MYHHFIITRKNEEKLRYVYIISSLQHGRMRKSCAVYILSLFCSREGSGRDLVCIYQHFMKHGRMSKVVVCAYFIASGGILPRMRNPEGAS